MMNSDFVSVFRTLAASDQIQEYLEKSRVMELTPNEELLRVDMPIQVVPFVLDGTVRVMREDQKGHELYLYHIQPGESCAMTLSSTLSNERSQVTAVTIEKTKLLAVPIEVVREWYRSDPQFRTFVLKTYNQRFEELLRTLDHVAFQQIDQRLIQFLNDRSQVLERNILHVTHQEFAG